MLLLIFKTDSSLACSCVELSFSQRASEASEIFLAHINHVDDVVLNSNESNPTGVKGVRASYDLVEVFKGDPQPSGYVLDTDISIDSCSLGIRPGVKYLVFLYNSRQVLACSGTQVYRAKQDRNLVNTLRQLKPQ